LPKIFVQSTEDIYGPRDQLEALYGRAAEPKRLVWIPAQDHFFAGALDQLEQVIQEVCESSNRGVA
jgi:alpha/beta superfamily hydrolase